MTGRKFSTSASFGILSAAGHAAVAASPASSISSLFRQLLYLRCVTGTFHSPLHASANTVLHAILLTFFVGNPGTMAPLESNIRKLPTESAQPYRTAPHNIEAEQALLGAILVNNEAFYRVSDFLEPHHFFEPVHQKIYDTARGLIRGNKVATPITLKTFLPPDVDIAGLSVSQYLARLAAEATTVINA